MIISVASGKGGTGKTTIAVNLALALQPDHPVQFLDCDVEEPNAHFFLKPRIEESREVFTPIPEIDDSLCTYCGKCAEVCAYNALAEDDIGRVSVDPLSCEGCGVCFHICPEQAVEMETPIAGEWYVSKTKYGPFVHARLGIAEENSGKLVTEVRKKAREVAESEKRDLVIMDGAPGIGCPVIASLTGTNLALVATEPTPSGRHDMERIVGLARHFKIRVACCINKFDLNLENSEQIQRWCGEQSIPVTGKIAFDAAVPESVVRGVPYVEYTSNSAADEIRRMWSSLLELIT